MSDEQHFSRNIDVEHIIGIDHELGRRPRRRPLQGRIIRAARVRQQGRRIAVIGGDSEQTDGETPPAIIIERDGERISRIIVKCPCGRQAELICEYDDGAEEHLVEDTTTAPPAAARHSAVQERTTA